MNNVITFHQFKEMIADHLGVPADILTKDTTFIDDLGIDSLRLVNFIIKLEKKYSIKIEMDKVWLLKNIGDAYNAFVQKIKTQFFAGHENKEQNLVD